MQAKFARLTRLATEDYLIRYANKGLYNRAQKDMEKGASAEYAFGENEVVCTLSDGTVCTLTESIERFDCSCPSEKICKHVLVAILYYGQHKLGAEGGRGGASPAESEASDRLESEAANGGEESSLPAEKALERMPEDSGPKPDFGWLLERPIEELVAPFQDSRVEEAAFRLRYAEELEIREDSLLIVRMVRSGIEVAFTDVPDVSRSLCAVPGAEGEMYRLEALLRYRVHRGREDGEALAGNQPSVRIPAEILHEFRESVNALLSSGLARLPRSFAVRFELLAVAARSGGLPNLEREARGIHGELELFFARHVRFSSQALRGRLSRTALMLDALEKEIGPLRHAQLAGRFRSRFYTVPKLDLYALGAEPWETRSSYRGITYYFYCAEDDGIYTYTQARAAYYEGAEFSFARHYGERSPWKPDLTLKTASASLLSLRAVKVSADGRLSSGGSPSLTLPLRPPVEAFDFGSLLAGRFADLDLGRSEVRLFGGQPKRLRLIRAAAMESCVYDPSAQALQLTAVDIDGERLQLTLPYHADWKSAITRLEAGRGMPGAGEFRIFASIEEDAVYPISFLQGSEQISLKLDL
ncbi:hypothetical protein [Saccharibacillus qingshengii]|uniref:hypothetical protein n=1 Tax=Saccharibacillus qingshengii TaxID=1763540 RepID=UPI001554DE17|nr:hypothetical protein [Saccharibacillus qingshengii]